VENGGRIKEGPGRSRRKKEEKKNKWGWKIENEPEKKRSLRKKKKRESANRSFPDQNRSLKLTPGGGTGLKKSTWLDR
jgi:DNA-binding transcriptional regulator PaaX